MPLYDARQDYTLSTLSEQDADADPFQQFDGWFQQARATELTEPNAMTLATATPQGGPSARIVLLKGYDELGFVFYANYESQKGRQISTNPEAALVFYWPGLQRQIRIAGAVSKISREESDAYFKTRPRESRLGAWASQQSQVIANREELEQRFQQLAEAYQDQEIPLPPFWGGFRLQPVMFEFWQGRADRLHDRLRYSWRAESNWHLERLAP